MNKGTHNVSPFGARLRRLAESHVRDQGQPPLIFELFSSVLAAVALTVLYVSSERTIYSSDYGGYADIAQMIAAQFRQSIPAGIAAVINSMGSEYNALFTLPLLPWILLFGESRLVFELALLLTYQLPLLFTLGLLAGRVIDGPPRVLFRSALVCALLTPMFWAPALRGYPDSGAALLLALAMLVYLRDPALPHRWQIVLLGLLLPGAFLFRRPFTYAVAAFCLAMGIVLIVRFVASRRRDPALALAAFKLELARLGLVGVVIVLVLAAVGRSFVARLLHNDYAALYADYRRTIVEAGSWYAETYGWLVLLAAGTGFLLILRRRYAYPQAINFLAVFGLLTAFAWLVVDRQISEQYTLNFTPFVLLGLVALIWGVLQWHSARRALALSGIAVLLVANSLVGLLGLDAGAGRAALALPMGPMQRNDMAELRRLLDYLRGLAPHGERVFVAASTSTIGFAALGAAENQIYGRDRAVLNIQRTPAIDSRDEYPLQTMLQARLVVLAEPFQHHLAADSQRVVSAVVELFTQPSQFAADFTALPQEFMLDGGVRVQVYQRVRPTSPATALTTLDFLKQYVGDRPGGQPDWLRLDPLPLTVVSGAPSGAYALALPLETGAGRHTAMLAHLGSGQGSSGVSGRLDFGETACNALELRAERADSAGSGAPLSVLPLTGAGQQQFSLSFAEPITDDVLLNFDYQAAPAAACTLRLDELQMQRQGGE